MWKNKVAGASAKKPKAKKNVPARRWNDAGLKYVTNDKVEHEGKVWICRRSHKSSGKTVPGLGYTYWKEHEESKTEPIDSANREMTTRGPSAGSSHQFDDVGRS